MNKYLLVLCILFTSCSSVPQKLDPKVYYKRDMVLEVNEFQGDGVLVVPYKDKYEFNITAQGKLDLFTFTTCHREQTKEKAGGRWYSGPKSTSFDYKPTLLESEGVACPAILAGYSKKGKHSWGIVEFEHPDLTLPALLSCDGSVYNTRGVSICQAKRGLLQEIKFSEEVIVAIENVCIELTSKDNKTFRFKMPERECTFRFVTKNGEEKWHRLTTVGYEMILVRGD